MKSRQIAPGDELRDVGRKIRLASDSRSATYVLFFRVNFISLVCCRLVLLRQLVWERNAMGELFFGDVMQSERGLFAMFVAIKNGVKNARIFVEKVPCFNVERIDNVVRISIQLM